MNRRHEAIRSARYHRSDGHRRALSQERLHEANGVIGRPPASFPPDGVRHRPPSGLSGRREGDHPSESSRSSSFAAWPRVCGERPTSLRVAQIATAQRARSRRWPRRDRLRCHSEHHHGLLDCAARLASAAFDVGPVSATRASRFATNACFCSLLPRVATSADSRAWRRWNSSGPSLRGSVGSRRTCASANCLEPLRRLRLLYIVWSFPKSSLPSCAGRTSAP
jgi:hypothetical protein